MRDLINGYGRDERITRLVDACAIYIVPCVDVDGKVHDTPPGETEYQNWRKNMRQNADGSVGVDLNRNASLRWGGSSSHGSAVTYQGAAPFSEPETRALRDFVDRRRVLAWLDIHSAGGMLFSPRYATAPEHERLEQMRLALLGGQAEPYYELRHGRQISPPGAQPDIDRAGNTGTLWQWAYYTRGVYAMNLEIRRDSERHWQFQHYPSVEFMEQEYAANGRAALLAWIDAAHRLPPTSPAVRTGTSFVVLDALTIDDDTHGESGGDGDGLAEPGETIELRHLLRNAGVEPAEAVWATLDCATASAQVLLEYRSHYGRLVPDAVKTVGPGDPRAPFVVRIDSDARPGESLDFTLHVFDAARRRRAIPFRLPVAGDALAD